MDKKKLFLSYSYDSDAHRRWVRKLADALEELEEVHVIWDGYDLDSLTDKNKFMESGIGDSDYIIVIATRGYQKKADERTGGVGIETYLAAATHWNELQRTSRTKILVVLREPDALPRYLQGHLYIDFTQDSQYPDSAARLLQHVRGAAVIPRPPKRRSLTSDEHAYNFTKLENLVRIGHTNRRAIVQGDQGTDFSGGNRIKYELWETKSPIVTYYLILADNINIAQTVSHAVERLKAAGITPTDLIVLRPRTGEKHLIQSLLTQDGLNTRIHELTYKDYIWNFCIDESLKGIDAPTEVENYTDQSIRFTGDDGNIKQVPSSRDELVKLLQKPSPISAHLVVAPGGMGKTSLCLAVAAKLHNRQDLHSSVILIQAEAIKRFVADTGILTTRLDSVFQLYELYARQNDFDQVFDRNTFELAFVSGNLVIIIDGLDEFASLFPDTFNLDFFLASLAHFHRELGSSSVLLTTRNSQLVEHARLEELVIERYDLLGFDRDACDRYLNRRFRSFPDSHTIATKVKTQIDKVQLLEDGRVVPFFADIAATVAEDALRENTPEELNINADPTPYPSNDELTDHIIYSVLRREEVRHDLGLPVSSVVELLSTLVSDFSKRWQSGAMLESLRLLYDERGPELSTKIALNPLLIQTGENIEFRYSFLASYFEVLHLLQGILHHSIAWEFVRSLARLSTESNEFRDLKRYFSKHRDKLLPATTRLVALLRKEADAKDPSNQAELESYRRAIAATLNLAVHTVGVESTQHVTDTVLQLYQLERHDESVISVSGLYLRGDFPAMDFSNLRITNSRFHNYKKLLSSKFKDSKFMYCVFESCFDPTVHSSSLDPKFLDQTCDLGDLREFVTLARAGKKDEQALIETEARRFLRSFFRGDRFVDTKPLHIKFSNKVAGLADNRFSRIIGEGYVRLKIEKEIAKFYEIDESFKPSVRRLLMDNYIDAKMHRFFRFLEGG